MLKVAGMVNKLGHFASRRLGDQYCDSGYYYDPDIDNCVPAGEVSSICDTGWYWDTALDNCQPYSTGGSGSVATDSGNSQIWTQIIAAAGKIATGVIQATSTQYRTNNGLYTYGTGPYSGLTSTLAQQYLASRSTFGGMNTTTMLLIGGGLLLAVMAMKR